MTQADVPARYRSSFCPHIWGGGSAAGYDSYPWTGMLADDASDGCVRHGGPTRANGRRCRERILSCGHTQGYRTMFRSFYGGNPRMGPRLRYDAFAVPGAHWRGPRAGVDRLSRLRNGEGPASTVWGVSRFWTTHNR